MVKDIDNDTKMNVFRAKGTFVKDDEFIYRTKTMLSFGNTAHVDGAVFLLNPGSLRLTNSEAWDELLTSKNQQEHSGNINIDMTMQKLRQIVCEAIPDFRSSIRVFYRKGTPH